MPLVTIDRVVPNEVVIERRSSNEVIISYQKLKELHYYAEYLKHLLKMDRISAASKTLTEYELERQQKLNGYKGFRDLLVEEKDGYKRYQP